MHEYPVDSPQVPSGEVFTDEDAVEVASEDRVTLLVVVVLALLVADAELMEAVSRAVAVAII